MDMALCASKVEANVEVGRWALDDWPEKLEGALRLAIAQSPGPNTHLLF
jgi:hypothetical protein